MNRQPYATFTRILLLSLLSFLTASIARAQTTTFTYQGRLTDGGTAANGNYDFQFALFDTNTVGTGTQQGSTVIVSNVLVTSGVFVVQLDFGAGVFSGANRFIEIAVKQTSASSFTTLGPRQPLTSTPYSIRSLNATTADGLSIACVSCITSSQIQSVSGRAVSGTIPVASVPSGSGNYIQNTKSQQSASFNISGNGTAGGQLSGNIVNATTQYNIGGSRVLSVPGTNNLFAGVGAGQSNAGGGNSFFGQNAGFSNTMGFNNSFFGFVAGIADTSGDSNSFFGQTAGFSNTTGANNSFVGAGAGSRNTTGVSNSFFGSAAGDNNTTGNSNIFIGLLSGLSNSVESNNTIIGNRADSAAGITNATAIGFQAKVTQSNSVVLGSINGINGATADTNVGIGATAPTEKLTVKTATGRYGFIHTDGTITVGSFVGGSTGGGWYGTKSNHSLSFFVNDGGPSMQIDTGGMVHIVTLGAAGSTPLCRNASNQISTCSSSLRYKTAVRPFLSGLEIINRLRPITFTWKQDGTRDLGLGAEDVAAVEPLLVIRNEKGEVEGVKYDHLNVVLINAIQEQQEEIKQQREQNERQQKQLTQQQQQIESLKRLVCRDHPNTEVCR